MNKVCNHCKELKPLGEFFTAPESGAQSWRGTGEFCKQCHAAGLIKHGYGSYGEKYTTPNFRTE